MKLEELLTASMTEKVVLRPWENICRLQCALQCRLKHNCPLTDRKLSCSVRKIEVNVSVLKRLDTHRPYRVVVSFGTYTFLKMQTNMWK